VFEYKSAHPILPFWISTAPVKLKETSQLEVRKYEKEILVGRWKGKAGIRAPSVKDTVEKLFLTAKNHCLGDLERYWFEFCMRLCCCRKSLNSGLASGDVSMTSWQNYLGIIFELNTI